MENLKRFYKSRSFLFLTIGIYGLLVFYTIINHEPWRDEALLCNTNTHSFFAAAAMGMLFLWSLVKAEKTIRTSKSQWFAIIIMLLGAGLAYYSIQVQADGWRPWLTNPINWNEPLDAIGNAFLPTCLTNPAMTLFFKPWSENVFFLAFLVVAIFSIRRSKNAVVFFVIATSGLLYILIFRYSGYLRHYGLILIFLLTAFWIYKNENEKNKENEPSLPANSLFSVFVMGFLSLSLFVSMLLGIYYMVKDIRYPFSSAKEMGIYIKEKNIAGEIISAYNIHTITAIYPYLSGISFWDPGLEKPFRYIHWDKDYLPTRQLSEADFMHRSLLQANGRNTYYILLTKPLSDPSSYGLALDFKVDSELITGDEKYYLHKNAQ